MQRRPAWMPSGWRDGMGRRGFGWELSEQAQARQLSQFTTSENTNSALFFKNSLILILSKKGIPVSVFKKDGTQRK